MTAPSGSTLNSPIILITGLNGYIAQHVAYAFISKEYRVRGTVRSSSKATQTRESFSKLKGIDTSLLEVEVVEDITKEGAFDEVVRGVHAVMHLAAPFFFDGKKASDYIDPSVKGTLSLLESAKKNAGPSLRRVLIASSVASISGTRAGSSDPTAVSQGASSVYKETDWNTHDVEEVERLGGDANGVVMYCAAKTLGEKAAWDFVEKHQAEISWDLVTICPPYVLGPLLLPTSPSNLNPSLTELYAAIIARSKPTEQLVGFRGNWVDVRDVADVCVKAVERVENSVKNTGKDVERERKRCLVVKGSFCWGDWYKTLNELALPYVAKFENIPKSPTPPVEYNMTNARKVFGIGPENMRELETTVKDVVESFKENGYFA